MGWSIPIIHAPAGQPKEIIVTGSTRVDAYYLATGERRWWVPYGSEGARGVPVWNGDSLIGYTMGHDKPWAETFDELLARYDTDKDGKVSRTEFQANKDWTE